VATVLRSKSRGCQSFAWLPSQSGGFAVCLQPQKNTVRVFSGLWRTGANPVPAWLPSQNGCVADRPQAHQKYFFPASTSME
jgi:hypothetical protein